MQIIPAIIPKTAEDLKDKLESVKGLADTVHIDFVNPLPTPSFIKEGAKVVDFLEAHLMVADSTTLIPYLVKDGFSRILVHAEALSSEAFAELIHEWKGSVEIGAVLEIDTPLSAIDSFAHELKIVQLMSIAHIGKQGEPFDERVIARVCALHAKYPRLTISVDGGVNKKNAEQLIAVGATRLVVGSHINEFYAR